ncbi:unnamed protein product [Psylliodes chrysocephalus]|uniref:Uncharacterized protein n=1 Tax=Psylliodes chrysocephalus TaxID=3402493 RepID=A0A9P0CP31_9CUCU|nr:unnamed protein product [Psylliodes chrysocephala]
MDPRETYRKRRGGGGSHGTDYEIHLSLFFLLYLFIHNINNFRISIGNEDAHPFDDIVYERERKKKKNTFLLQAKHFLCAGTLSFSDFDTKGRLDIGKHLNGFQRIKIANQIENIQNVIICTNSEFNIENINQTNEEEIIKLRRDEENHEGLPIFYIPDSQFYRIENMPRAFRNGINENDFQTFLNTCLLSTIRDENLIEQIHNLITDVFENRIVLINCATITRLFFNDCIKKYINSTEDEVPYLENTDLDNYIDEFIGHLNTNT